jgi:hypothetical protein
MTDIEYHPIAKSFPLIEGEAWKAFLASVKERGCIQIPGLMFEGKLLDGRNRERAARELGLPFPTEDSGANTWDEALAIAKTCNLDRKQYTLKELAFSAANLANIRHGHNRYTADIAPEKVECAAAHSTQPISLEAAAKALGVAKSTVQNAKVILDRGTPEEKAEAKNTNAGLRHVADNIRRREKGEAKKEALPRGRRPNGAPTKEQAERDRVKRRKLREQVIVIESACASLNRVEYPPFEGDERRMLITKLKNAKTDLSAFLTKLSNQKEIKDAA